MVSVTVAGKLNDATFQQCKKAAEVSTRTQDMRPLLSLYTQCQTMTQKCALKAEIDEGKNVPGKGPHHKNKPVKRLSEEPPSPYPCHTTVYITTAPHVRGARVQGDRH